MKMLTNTDLQSLFLGALLSVVACAVNAVPITITTTDYDLTHINSYALINSAIFTTPDNTTTVGTGVFDPFVRIQAQNGQDTVENGYNTDGQPQYDTKAQKPGTPWVHSLLLSNISTRDVGGVLYREFFLDINEANGGTGQNADQYLSLDDFRLFLGSVGNMDNYNLATNTLSKGANTATKVYDLDTSTINNTVGLDYSNFSGSGKGIDLTVLVPNSVFTGSSNQYVYLYSSFGSKDKYQCTGPSSSCPATTTLPALPGLSGTHVSPGTLPVGNYGASAGFEEWSTRVGIPEPATYWLLGVGVIGLLGWRRRSL